MDVRNQVAAVHMRKVLHLPVLALLAAMAIPAAAATPEETAREVLAKSPIIDGHNDTPHQIAELFDRDFSKFDLAALPADVLAKTHTDIKTARAGYLGGQYWSVYVDAALPKHEAVTRTIQQIDVVRQMMARYPETFTYAATAAQVEAAIKKGKIASLIGMEGGHSIGGSLEILRQTYALGARYMTLTHSLTTNWADSATDAPKHDGLSAFGFEVLAEMNQLGMIVDISHVGEATFWDAIKTTTKPVIASHSNAYTICPVTRNLKDDQIKAVGKNGGVIHLNFFSAFVDSTFQAKNMAFRRKHKTELDALLATGIQQEYAQSTLAEKYKEETDANKPDIEALMKHLDHIVKLIGVDHVGLGSDFDGIDSAPKQLKTVVDYPEFTKALIKRGYSDTDIEKILGGNFLRVYRMNNPN